MFYVNTLISRPDRKINDLSLLKSNVGEYFVQINNTREVSDLENLLDFDYLSGAITLTYCEQTLLDVTIWDLVDQLWAYILNVIESLLNTGEGETYFPDQPVKLRLKSVSGDLVLYEIEANDHIKVLLPKNEFIETLLEGADVFFRNMEECFNGKCSYQYEIDKIETLRRTTL
ncbi:hypothetical protein EJP82_25880 [Paenibacillus anaericanus]|uniref:Uncharacterized protein n=1 Tax=Paenibacillus anaericanus TaxID=170367 RepID=A0A433XXC1_9BACL|nr:hypothetical protein [Paenibacillus anaericanus]RUT39512.1 hypothetical protein EJP82_25880 [Paenibacillus anaericanus]